jgi:two-component system, LytTR family, response regulator
MRIRTLVADDQPMARERLLTLLSEERDVDVVGIAETGPDTVAAVRRLAPDLVFLDIQMPEMDGLAVVEAIGPDRMPSTIFVTAYDAYAVRAFDVHAIDYLLKPYGRLRLQKALARVRRIFERDRTGALATRLLSVIEELRRPAGTGERLIIRADGRVTFVAVDDVDWVEAEGNYVRVHTDRESHLMRETMHSLQQRLGNRFFRIHRSCIVNVARVQELRIASGGDYNVILQNGTSLALSRQQKDALRSRLTNAVDKTDARSDSPFGR